jgi:hypothetical protein
MAHATVPLKQEGQGTAALQPTATAVKRSIYRHPRLPNLVNDRAGVQLRPLVAHALEIGVGPGEDLLLRERWKCLVVPCPAELAQESSQRFFARQATTSLVKTSVDGCPIVALRFGNCSVVLFWPSARSCAEGVRPGQDH